MDKSIKVSLALQDIAGCLEDVLENITGERIAFVLVVSVGNTAQYASNANRTDGTQLLEDLLGRWKANRADIPAHYNPDLKT